MNILLLDDESYVIESIRQNVGWEELPKMQIYTANNIGQGKMIMNLLPIQIIVSDIVLQQGTGFQFMEWVRQEKFPVQVIFLTSYAQFDYAKQAIELESIEYLLKPIDYAELTQALKKAMIRCETQLKHEEFRVGNKKWNHNKHLVHETFLKKAAASLLDKMDIEKHMEGLQLDFTENDLFVPVYIHFYGGHVEQENWEDPTLRFIIRNLMEELLQHTKFTVETVFMEESYRYMMFLHNHDLQKVNQDILVDSLDFFVTWIKKELHNDIWCGVGRSTNLVGIYQCFEDLRSMRIHNLNTWNCVMHVESQKLRKISYTNPNILIWSHLLQENKTDTLLTKIEFYLNQMEREEMITLEFLKKFRMDMVQLIYSYLAKEEITAHLLFSSSDSEKQYQLALEGMKGAKEFFRHYVNKAIDYTTFVRKPQSVVEKLVQHLNTHYHEEIHRSDLAELVYLNTDYISRIFKKETGVSISSYLIQKRVEEAKKYLTETRLPINAVSIDIGYSNFAYFTKLFRENTGYSPLEYRRKFKRSF